MRREDVKTLLGQAADRLPEPDLADAAWAGGVDIRRRRRRSTVAALVLVVLIAVVAALVAGFGGGRAGISPPTTLPSVLTGQIPPTGQIAGLDFWIAPPSGSEAYLDRVATPLGDSLRLPNDPAALQDEPLDQIAAVVLSDPPGPFEPLLLGKNGRWARADVQLTEINTGPPLSAGAVSPNGRFVAFPQHGAVIVVDATNAGVQRFNVPAQDIRSVSWLPDSDRLLLGGPDVAYRILTGQGGFGERSVTELDPSSDPDAVTAPYRLGGGVGQVQLLRYAMNGGWFLTAKPELPAEAWVGQTFTGGNTAARLLVSSRLPQVVTAASRPQMVAAISAQPNRPSRLLVLGETPSATPPPTPGPAAPEIVREPGCCFVLGWFDDNTVLVQVQGWVISWELSTGKVRRVTELEVSRVALGPGIRG
ncbi:hypothetical protein GCM10009744_05160 [Kribbella alba]|uniref:WD40 repeat domain-containing protein n=1 Tax=Kribbella alba TaxID=190197 RepID=A0ABN2EXH0_9ACTN